MFSIFNRQIRFAERSPRWTSIRKMHLSVNDYCSACGRKTKLEVHHIKPVHMFPDLELDLSNLVTLCADPCHILFGHLMNFKSYNKEVIKDCTVYFNKVKNRP
jgi:5-methylcytosine-specific restriction endonuclease McrA